MSSRYSKILGATLLVAGCSAGAGMLGLPLVSSQAGFLPSSFILFLSWGFMVTTGLLFLEATLWFDKDVNLLTIAESSLGKVGKWIAGCLFIFLFDCLLVAYVSANISLLSHFAQIGLGICLDTWMIASLFSLLGGLLLFLGTYAIDLVNRLFMGGFVLFYFCLIAFGAPYVNVKSLLRAEWKESFFLFPTMIISFGFHNLVPSLSTYLNKDKRGLQFALIAGSLIPLICYLLWDLVIFGLIPEDGHLQFQQIAADGEFLSALLSHGRGGSYFSFFVQGFSFFALITSFLGVSLSFVDFLADGLSLKKRGPNRILLSALTLLPPLLFSLAFPRIFIQALNFAGAFGAVLLFGVLPCLIVWKGRRHRPAESQIIKGGNSTLLLIIFGALFVFFMQLIKEVYG